MFNLITNNSTCYELITQTVPFDLIYYSHIPTVLLALFVSFFIFFKSGKILSSKLLLIVSILFSLWSLCDLITWTSYDTRLTMFAWAPLGFLFMLIFAFSLYFTYVFFDKEDISLAKKIAIFLPVFPVIALTPTALNLVRFSNENCEAVEGVWFTNYYHLFGAFVLLWIAVIAMKRYRITPLYHDRVQIILFTLGIELFLISFFIWVDKARVEGNFFSSLIFLIN